MWTSSNFFLFFAPVRELRQWQMRAACRDVKLECINTAFCPYLPRFFLMYPDYAVISAGCRPFTRIYLHIHFEQGEKSCTYIWIFADKKLKFHGQIRFNLQHEKKREHRGGRDSDKSLIYSRIYMVEDQARSQHSMHPVNVLQCLTSMIGECEELQVNRDILRQWDASLCE